MARASEKMQKLQELRDGLVAEINQRERELDGLRNRLRGVDAAIAAISGGEPQTDPKRRNRRNVKTTVMDMIVRAGSSGVTAAEIVQEAAMRGKQLDRPSISSLLSRLKREGLLSFNGERYYPIETEVSPGLLKVIG